MMTLDEAIRHCEEVADSCGVTKCEMEHRQLAEWLKELKQRRTEQRWIPCSEKLPEEEDSIFAKFYGTDRWRETMMRKRSDRVIVTAEYQNGNRITDVAGTCDGKWVNDISAMYRKIVAWQPLPEPYKGE